MKKIFTTIFVLTCIYIQAQTTQDTIDKPYWKDMMADHSINFFKTKRAYDLYFSNKAKVKGTGWKHFERWADNWSKVINKDGTFSAPDKLEKTMTAYNKNKLSLRSAYGTWSSIGPNKEPTFGKWAGGNVASAGTGRINVLAIHPTNSDIMYAGVPQGGLWKTTNAGVSWIQVPGMSNAQGISAIALFADDANLIIVGTGDRDGGDAPGRGIWISTNGGTSFAQKTIVGITGGGLNFKINKIIVNPLNSNSLMATSSSAVLKSIDKGQTWTYDRLNEGFLDIAYAPNDTNTVYMTGNSGSSTSDNFYLSTDGGTTFNTSMSGITSSGIERSFLATTPANPNIVYLLRAMSAPMEGLYKSSNKGASWTKILDVNTFNLLGYETNGSDVTKGQGFFDVAIYADNLDSNKLIVGGVNLYQSTNGGTTWAAKTCWNGCNSLPVTHSDVHYITKNTDNNTYFICNDGGLYKTMDFTTFTPIYDGMVISQFYDIDVTAAENGKIVGGLQDNSMVERKNGNWSTHIGGDGMFAEVSDFDPNLMVGSSQNGGLEITKNGFATSPERFANGEGYGINEAGPWVTPFQMSPFNDNIFVSAFTTKVFYTQSLRSIDPSNKIATTFKSLPISGEGSAVRFSAIDSNTCFVGTKTGNIYKINNLANGSTPSITQLASPNNGGFAINDIETSSKDVNKLWVVLDSMVYLSINGGTSWNIITGNLPAVKMFSIVVDKYSDFDRAYVGAESGVYYNCATFVDNSNWSQFNQNLPQYTHIRDLEIWYDTFCSSNTSLFAATYGRGAWKSDLHRAEDVNFDINGSMTPAVNTSTTYQINFKTGLLISKAKWTVSPSTGVTFANNNSDSAKGVITFAFPGVYTITVKSFNSQGGYCTKSINVTVGTPPTITAKISSNNPTNKICSGDSVILTASGGVSYTISPSINTSKTNNNTFVVKPTSTTLYTLTAVGPTGQTDTDSLKITVNSMTPIAINPASSTVVSGSSVNIAATGNISYVWTPSTYLTTTSKVATITSKPSASITYTVEGTDVHGCKSVAQAIVNVSPAPLSVQVASTTTNSVCKGSKVTLKGSGASSYTLSPMTNVVKLNDSMFDVSPQVNTNYYLTGTTGTNSGTDSIAITVNAIPNISVNTPLVASLAGTSKTITATGASSYVWTPNVFVVSGLNSNAITVAPTSTTLYTVVGTDVNGCKGSSMSNVIVPIFVAGINPPSIKLIRSTPTDSICKGENIVYTVRRTISGKNGTPTKINYTFNPMTNVTKVNDTTFEIIPSTSTMYVLTGIDENNLVGADTANITVLPTPTVSISPSSAYVMLGNTQSLTASGGGTYSWSPSTFVTSDTTSAVLAVTPTNYINYEVEVEGTNGCVDYMEVPVGVYTLRTVSETACGSYVWGGNTYTSSGTYSDTFEASSGIDSIVSLNLTIRNSAILVPAVTISTSTSPYLWRGKYYTNSGTYFDTVVGKSTCDSIFELKLTINTTTKKPTVLDLTSTVACNKFVWRNKTYTTSGIYNDTAINSVQDTIYRLILSIDLLNETVSYSNGEFASNCYGCTYQWYVCNGTNYIAIQNATSRTLKTTSPGDYKVTLNKGNCSGSSACVNKISASLNADLKHNITIFPNPVSDELNVSIDRLYTHLEVTILDLTGRIILKKAFKNVKDIIVPVYDLSVGNYIIVLSDGEKLDTRIKFTKK